MKTRILFVDDEPMVLQGLQRLLRSMRSEWDLAFVPGGKEALALLEEAPFDVVVSDMRMPGMDGATLLNEVMHRHPRTLRVILSGHADRDLIMRCVGATHQYLSKPCDIEMLKATIRDARRRQEAVSSDALKNLLGRIGTLPSPPQVYVEINQRLQEPEVGTEEIARIIERDVAMTAQILKLVNSAFFGLGRPIGAVNEAVGYLGVETLRSLLLAMHAWEHFETPPDSAGFVNDLWSHSLMVSAGSRLVAEAAGSKRSLADECFSAGLLHDLGKLILCCKFPKEYREVRRRMRYERTPCFLAETEVFTVGHPEVGSYLLALWGLPRSIVEAIAWHHTPLLSQHKSFTPLTAVHVANRYCRTEGADAREVRWELDSDYLKRCGVHERVESWKQLLLNPPRARKST